MTVEVAAVLQMAIGVTFLWAAAAKVGQRVSVAPFLLSVGFSAPRAVLASRALPLIEAVLGLVLLSDTVALPAALAAALIAASFSGVLLHAYKEGIREPCRCFGRLDTDQLSIVPVLRSVLLACSALWLTAIYLGDMVVTTHTAWFTSPAAGITGLVVGGAYVMVFALLEQVWFFHHGSRALVERM